MKNAKLMLSLLIVALLAIGFIAGCGSSSDSGGGGGVGNCSGKVTDANGTPINGATCTITTTTAKATYSDTTDENGEYLIVDVPIGTWPMTISATGYQTVTVNVTVNEGQTTTVPTQALPAAGTGTVTGTVVSSLVGGGPIAGATVTIGGQSTTTSATGTYTISGINAGTQTVTATATGYNPYSGTVTVVANTTVTHNITMTPASTVTPTASPTIQPGKGNVTGKVTDSTGAPLAGVTVTEQKAASGTTDANGIYVVANLDPGVRVLAYSKTGYLGVTQSVTVQADTTVTAPTVALATAPSAGTTLLVTKRINQPQVRDAWFADVSKDGTRVSFQSSGNVSLQTWDNPTNTIQIYVWDMATGTITRMSNNKLVPGSTAGAGPAGLNSFNAKISGDGKYVVFISNATNILPDGLASGNMGDVFMVSVDDLSIKRISSSATNENVGGNDPSFSCDTDDTASKVVFETTANNVNGDGVTYTADYSHILLASITKGKAITVGTRRMLDQYNNVEGSNAGGNPLSTQPRISANGRYTVFASQANNILASNNPAGGTWWQIYRNDNQADPAVGWNMACSTHQGNYADAHCLNPEVNSSGTRVVFDSAATNLGYANTVPFRQVYLYNLNSPSLTLVSVKLSGAEGDSTNPVIDDSGKYVGFYSETIGLVSDVTALPALNNGFCYVKDVDLGQNVYTLVSRGASGQVPNWGCFNPRISGDGTTFVWHSAATNLTNDNYNSSGSGVQGLPATTQETNVFIRKWQ